MEQLPDVISLRTTRPPDWRYQEARSYVEDERHGRAPTVPTDPIVQYTIRALRGYLGSGSRRYLMHSWGTMEDVLYYGLDARKSALTAELEVCLIKGWTWEESRKAGCPFTREVYELYASIFFDLGEMKKVQAWVNDFLFEPERYKENTTLLRSRMLAYFGEGDIGSGAAVTGMLTSDEETLMKKLSENERQKKIFEYMVKKTKLDPVTYASIMEAAVKGMTDRDFQEHMKDREDAASGSLEELAEHMEEGIRAYSQKELLQAEPSGVDFVNQYTKTITGKVNDGKEDIGS